MTGVTPVAEPAVVEAQGVSKYFGSVIALNDISMAVHRGEVHCLLGDNGAGKSTLIKTFAGVHKPDRGRLCLDGAPLELGSPRHALNCGIATVYQDLAMVPLMSITRNFFMGREPAKGRGPLRRFDVAYAERIARERLAEIGIDVRDPGQAVGTLSGGERQCLAIARAIHFGARVLILDEPTSALGVHQAGLVLRYIAQAAHSGLAVVLITHNVHHAYPVGDKFTMLNRGRSLGTFAKSAISRDKVLSMMAGGQALEHLNFERTDGDGSDAGARRQS